MKLFYCPACSRVYYLPEESNYLCGRVHTASVWPDGRMRRFFISERTEANRPPWAVPDLAEERELLNDNVTETFLGVCQHPEDQDYGDMRRHFGYGAPGARHLTKDMVLDKYALFHLKRVEPNLPSFLSGD